MALQHCPVNTHLGCLGDNNNTHLGCLGDNNSSLASLV